jgi:site-specific DNA-methyltransferase (adenine-specific)
MIITGDCRTDLKRYAPFDLLIADPPYGDTSLDWDQRCSGWIEAAGELLKPTGSLWVFGSMRFFQEVGFGRKWQFAQDIVWEKHNGSGFHADRFKRVHEHACQYYLASAPWASVYNDVQTTPDAVARSVRRKKGRPAHMGNIEQSAYESEDGGPLIMRSVIYMRSMHGRAIHPTEKPSDLLEILIRTSCPPDGIVGDMFAGSGAAGEAAVRAGRRYVGCEIDPSMARAATNRLDGLLPLSLKESA